ncbi:leucine--tRNA ligase [Candidatus Babeliales bacterium]|nr:leucine--tRNA ligase [Candidatus Babeliales bacterium]
MSYSFKGIEKKWQESWKKDPYFRTKKPNNEKKYYCLDMFPYPSGSGLHIGHWKGYVLSDVYARKKFLEGYNVLHPMGWDAFGLPAENDAIKKRIHPKESTSKNIRIFKNQLDKIGTIYDWSRELNTTDSSYYKWTQWIFLKMYKAGLAYESTHPINWCPSCKTGLANEEVINGKCERCGTTTEKKPIRQWMLKITEYAEKLLNGLDKLNWPVKVKQMQRNWIGKSEGLLFTAPVKDTKLTIQTFSAHFESCFADTFVTIAPDHPFLSKLLEGISNKKEILQFCKQLLLKREQDPVGSEKEPEGIFTGRYIVDPLGNGDLPIWVASFVLSEYGTGIVKCSAHDERDFRFAKKYKIPLKPVLFPSNPDLKKQVEDLKVCYIDMKNGILTEPKEFNGQVSGEVRNQIIKYCVEKDFAEKKVFYKMHDWVFSRQRYWGEPIPLIHCTKCGIVPIPEKDLPIVLPEIKEYAPTETGESPLAEIKEWVNTTCPQCRGAAKRETNTMPQWAGSCWYFLRYPNPDLTDKPFSKENMNYWLPVDLYVGGIEHAILHLLYARFYIKFLHDQGYLSFDEPFQELFNQGMVCTYSKLTGKTEKMSKSKGNVVNPDDVVNKVGTDALRMYILFMGPPELDTVWQTEAISGTSSFLNRLWLFINNKKNIVEESELNQASLKRFHLFLKEFEERIDAFKVNTAVSAAMEYLNDANNHNLKLSRELLEKFLVALSIMIPHFSSEALETLLNKQLQNCSWPAFDKKLAEVFDIEIAIQINGRVRSKIVMAKDSSQEKVENKAKEVVARWLENKNIVKVIFIPNRIISFVVK